MHVKVLGKSPSWQDAAGACSGYLVREGALTLLLDCGSGVFSKLRREVDYLDVDVVVISHLHADHFLDLIPFSYALANACRGGRERARAPRLHLPSGGTEVLRRIVGCWGGADLVDNAFEITEYSKSDELELEALRVRFCEVPHFTVSHAVELSCGGSRFTFGADCRPNRELVEFAADTDMLMIEATLPLPEQGDIRGHLTPREAGEHGAAARARRLVLTHYSDEMDPEWARRQAAESYGGPVEMAREGAVYAV